jgi:hypothetical protein
VEGDRPHEAVHISPDWVEDEKIIHKLFSANLIIQHLLSELRKMPGTERTCIPDEFTLVAMRVRRVGAEAQISFSFRLMLTIHQIIDDVRARPRQEMASRIYSVNRTIEYTAIEQPRGKGPYWCGPEDSESAQLLKKFFLPRDEQDRRLLPIDTEKKDSCGRNRHFCSPKRSGREHCSAPQPPLLWHHSSQLRARSRRVWPATGKLSSIHYLYSPAV